MKILWKTIKSIIHVFVIFIVAVMFTIVKTADIEILKYMFVLLDLVWIIVFFASISGMVWEDSIDYLRSRKLKRIKYKFELNKVIEETKIIKNEEPFILETKEEDNGKELL